MGEEFASSLEEEIGRHGPRWGFLTHFVKEAVRYASVKHMPSAAPHFHNRDERGLVFDETCIRCNLEKAIEHVERPEWNEGRRS